jgi:hypothetical protein
MNPDRPIEIREKLLKDSFNRIAETSDDVTKVLVDLRKDTHDVVHVYIRGTVCGQLVTDKNDSVTIARRLIPESMKYGKEPATIVRNMEQLGQAYGELFMEVRTALSHGSVDSLRAYMKRIDATSVGGGSLPGDGHLFISAGMARAQAEDQKHNQAHGS